VWLISYAECSLFVALKEGWAFYNDDHGMQRITRAFCRSEGGYEGDVDGR
jgi:hypothetical protein